MSGGQLSILFISSCGAQQIDALQGGDGAKEGGATTARAAKQKDEVRQLSRLVHTRAQPSAVWSAKTTGFKQACTCHQQLHAAGSLSSPFHWLPQATRGRGKAAATATEGGGTTAPKGPAAKKAPQPKPAKTPRGRKVRLSQHEDINIAMFKKLYINTRLVIEIFFVVTSSSSSSVFTAWMRGASVVAVHTADMFRTWKGAISTWEAAAEK